MKNKKLTSLPSVRIKKWGHTLEFNLWFRVKIHMYLTERSVRDFSLQNLIENFLQPLLLINRHRNRWILKYSKIS